MEGKQMSNPKIQAAVVLEAYAVGQEKLGTKPKGLTHEMIEKPIGGAPVAAGWHPSLQPGQNYASRGTTIFNPQPSDIEVETVLGKKVYDPKPDPRSKEEIVLTATTQAQEISQLKELVFRLLSKQQTAPEPVIEPIEPIAVPDISELSMAELRTKAQPLGIKTARMSKENLVEAIRQAV